MRAVGLVLVLGLSGAPAAVAACAAACLPDRDHAAPAMNVVAPADRLDGAPPGHAHHHAPATPAAAPAAPAHGSSSIAASASVHPCCPEPQTLTAVSVEVAGARATGVPVAVTTPVWWRQAWPSWSARRTARPPAAASAGARTPLVLRI